jgi:hypothetical protein
VYRFDSIDSPDFGTGTVWTTQPENAKWLADWHGGADPSTSQLYRADVIIGDDVVTFEVSDAIPNGWPDASGLVVSAARTASRSGYRWVRFTDQERPWRGAMLYLGDELVPAYPALVD